MSIIAGFATQIRAALTGVLMLGIIFTSHLDHGFFMNWVGTQKGEGYEYHFLLIGLSLALIANGSGKYSIEGKINEQMKRMSK